MNIAEVLLLDFDQEIAHSRRTLERIPENKPDWAPHAKSMPMGRLAVHVAQLPQLATIMLTTPEFDLTAAKRPPLVFDGREKLLSTLDETSAEARRTLASATDERLMAPWRFRAGDRILAEAPRAALYRALFLNHMVHHRAQLGVYLRLNDEPVPSIYGPSADDRMGF